MGAEPQYNHISISMSLFHFPTPLIASPNQLFTVKEDIMFSFLKGAENPRTQRAHLKTFTRKSGRSLASFRNDPNLQHNKASIAFHPPTLSPWPKPSRQQHNDSSIPHSPTPNRNFPRHLRNSSLPSKPQTSPHQCQKYD